MLRNNGKPDYNFYEYFNLRKNYLKIIGKKIISIFAATGILLICFAKSLPAVARITIIAIVVFFISDLIYISNINGLLNEIKELKKSNELLQSQIDYQLGQRTIEIKLIDDKVNQLHKFIKGMYPGYDYQSKINRAIDATNDIEQKINDIPENLLPMLLEQKFKSHRVENYRLTLPGLLWPLDSNAFTASAISEYGTYRPYRYMGYKHEGIDLIDFFNSSVYACYDAEIYNKYYDEGGGWSLELKFSYNNPEGKPEFYFVRYRHLEEIYVKIGDKVNIGSVVASMGSTGYFSSGKHLHFELWKWNGKKFFNINPVLNSTWNVKHLDNLFY